MNPEYTLLTEFSAWLAQNALNLLIQSTVLISIGLTAAFLLRRHGSAVQSAIYRATLVCILACPIAGLVISQVGLPAWTIQLPETSRQVSYEIAVPSVATDLLRDAEIRSPDSETEDATFITDSANVDEFSITANSESSTVAAPAMTFPPSPVSSEATVVETMIEQRSVSNHGLIAIYGFVGMLWIMGTVCLSIRLILAYRKLNRLRRRSIDANQRETALCQKLADQIRVQPPEVCRNALLSSPCLVGITSPAILLPSEINGQVPMEKAFAHELAHLRRHDTFWNLIQRIALTLFFYQPLMWRLVYRLETTAEEVCDDYVVHHCMDRTGYAQQLVELAESNLLPPNMAGLGMFNSRSLLGRRVIRILDSTRNLTTHINRKTIVGIVALAMVCGTLGGFVGNGAPFTNWFGETSATRQDDETDNTEDKTEITVSGRVLDHKGKPISGAQLKVFPSVYYAWNKPNPQPLRSGTTDASGNYTFRFSSELIPVATNRANQNNNFNVVATATGHSIGCYSAVSKDDFEETSNGIAFKTADIQLGSSTLPIKLTLIDPEGNPIVGASAKVNTVLRLVNDDPQPVFDAFKEGAPLRHVYNNFVDYDLDSIRFNDLESIVSDGSGQIVIPDLGDNRLVEIELSGKTIAIQSLTMITADFKMVSSTEGMLGIRRTNRIYGAEATITCEPTHPIIGVARDLKTKKPLSGVRIVASQFAGTDMMGMRSLTTTTDDDGRFELYGMPKGSDNWITALPDDDTPYFMQRVRVPEGPGLEPIEMNVDLQRGIFIRGKVTNKTTGEPVGFARFEYSPFSENPIGAASPAFGDEQFMEFQGRYLSDVNGEYQLVGLPGGGIVGLTTLQGFYPTGQGWEEIDESKINPETNRTNTLDRVVGYAPDIHTAMKQIEVAEDQTEFNVDFAIDPGLSMPLKVVDAENQPVTDFNCERIRSNSDYKYVSDSSMVMAGAFKRGQKRYVKLVHEQREIGRALLLDSNQLAPDGTLEKPIEVQLLPYSHIRGKLVDGDGDPVVGAQIRMDISGGNFSMMIYGGVSDKDGKFEFRKVVPCDDYTIHAEHPDHFFSIAQNIEVDGAEVLDFGVMDASTRTNSIKPTRTKIGEETKPKSDAEEAAENQQAFSGRVVNDEGQPVAGVRVFQQQHAATSDADGQFTIDLPFEKIKQANGRSILGATKDGFGFSYCYLTHDTTEGIEIELVPDDHPIRGRLIDIEGSPVAGAIVEVEQITQLRDATIQDYIEKAKQPGVSINQLPSGLGFEDKRIRPVTTAADGSFELKNIGSNRVVQLKIKGDKVAFMQVRVLTTKCDELSVRRWSGIGTKGNTSIYGHQATIACEPTRPIQGVVVDSETGQPLPHVDVYSYRFADTQVGGLHDLKTTTDAQGRFELLGMPKGAGNAVSVSPDYAGENALPYFGEHFEIPDSNGLDPVQVELKMTRGVWVSGQAIDKQTGKPIAAARVAYKPFLSNELANSNPLFTDGKTDAVHPGPVTDANGNYRIPALPGKGVVDIWCVSQGQFYPGGQGFDSIDDEQIDDEGEVQVYGFAATASHPTMIRQIDINEGAEQTVNFTISPGKSVKVTMVDPQGQPIGNVKVRNARSNTDDAFVAETSEFQATSFLPGQTRSLVFTHDERNLGAVVDVSESMDSPVIATLQSYANVKFQLVDGDGDPVKQAITRFDILQTKGGFSQSLFPTKFTDESGNLQRTVVPGKYRIVVQTSDQIYFVYSEIEFTAGQQADLGTIDVTKGDMTRFLGEQETKKESEQDLVVLTGAVVDSSDNPVAGVQLTFAIHQSLSDDQGKFELKIPREKLEVQPQYRKSIYAARDGYGVSSTYIDLEQLDQHRIVMTGESCGITGRLIDTEGNPVVGAKIKADQIREYPGCDFDKVLNAALTDDKAISRLPQSKPVYSGNIKPATSDANGQFTIDGIGDNRMAMLIVTGEKIATVRRAVSTTTIDRLDSEEFDWPFNDHRIHGNDVTIVCEPSQPISGVVVDKKSGKPIEGLQVAGIQIIENTPGMIFIDEIAETRVITDSEGRFHITGLKITGKRQVIVRKAFDDSNPPPYFGQTFDVIDAAGVDQIEMQCEVTRGVMVHGRVTDADTGKPLASVQIDWGAYPENEAVASLDVRRQREIRGRKVYTNKDGYYRLVAMPGPALLRVIREQSGQYPPHQGIENIDPKRRTKDGIQTLPVLVQAGLANKEINVPDDKDLEVNFELTTGESVRVKLVDPEGKPVSGAEIAYGASAKNSIANDDEFEIGGFLADGKRSIVFQHLERKLGATRIFRLDEDQPIVVQLQAMATVTARMVDDLGNPADVPLLFEPMITGHSNIGRRPADDPDENGRVTKHLVPGLYLVSYRNAKTHSGYKKIDVKAGQRADFGDIDITKRWAVHSISAPGENWIEQIPVTDFSHLAEKTDEPMMDEPDQQLPESKQPTKDDGQLEPAVVSGTVTDSQDQKLAGVKTRAFIYWRIEGGRKLIAEEIGETTTDENGAFQFSVNQKHLDRLANAHSKPKAGYTDPADAIARGLAFTAEASGHGPNFAKFESGQLPQESIMLKLPTASTPIRGKVVDLEGNPVADVEVKSVGFFLGQGLDWDFAKPVKTDASGNFEIIGAGDNSMLWLQVSGKSVGTRVVEIKVDQREPYSVDPDTSLYDITEGYGANPVIAVESARTLVGIVTDKDTGLPLVGVVVSYGPFERKQSVKTDNKGRYELHGIVVPKNQDVFSVRVQAGDEYFDTRIREFPVQADSYEWQHDIVLPKATIIRGKLIDSESGEAVQGAVMYYPRMENTFAEAYPNFDKRVRSYNQVNRAITNEQGEFSIRAIDGEGVLAVRALKIKEYESAEGDLGIDSIGSYYHLPQTDRFNRLQAIDIDEETAQEIVVVAIDAITEGN